MARAPPMRPADNFRHDRRKRTVVEVPIEEFDRIKQETLTIMRNRVRGLAIVIGLVGTGAILLGIGLHVYFSNLVKFDHLMWGIKLKDLYFVYGAICLAFCVDAGYLNGNWGNLRNDGSALVMHVHLFLFMGFISWLGSVWLLVSLLQSFSFVDASVIFSGPSNIIYFITLILNVIHVAFSPGFFRTVQRKAFQADMLYGCSMWNRYDQFFFFKWSDGWSALNLFSTEFVAEKQKPARSVVKPRDPPADDDGFHDLEQLEEPVNATEEVDEPPANPKRKANAKAPGRAYVKKKSLSKRDLANLAMDAADSEEDSNESSRQQHLDSTQMVSPPEGIPSSKLSPRSAARSRARSPRRINSPTTASPRSMPPASASSSKKKVSPPPSPNASQVGATLQDVEIPFASPVFLLDARSAMPPSRFWPLWRQTETSGSFTCLFKNNPSLDEIERHLKGQGFHVISTKAEENLLELYFYGVQLGTDIFFLAEFILILNRRFFQATFKCKDQDVATAFVTHFNLQELLVVQEEEVHL